MTDLDVREPGSLELLAELERSGGISTIGLHLSNPDLPYGQYEALCRMLGVLHESVKFAIGDAILLGEQLYGEEAFQAIESMNLSEETRRECLRVSSRVARSRRRTDLSWSHHRAVAALTKKTADGRTVPDAQAQKEWLKRAADENLSHHALRDALRNGEAPDPQLCRCCHRPLEK